MEKQNITIVVATGLEGEIGKDNQLLWHLPADLKHFKNITTGKPIIMGRKTFESIGKALPDRLNVVVSRQKLDIPEGVLLANSLEEAVDLCGQAEEICIIGGGNIYDQAIKFANKLEHTIVQEKFDADTFFPKINKNEWELVKTVDFEADDKNPYPYSFSTLLRK